MYLIDTDIIIYSLKGVPEVVNSFRKYANEPKAISVITYGELVYGAEKSQFRINNLAKVHRVRELFPVAEVTPAIMDTFGELKADLSKDGIIIDDFDLIIAATALSMGYSIVTNNEKNFSRIPNLTLHNWMK